MIDPQRVGSIGVELHRGRLQRFGIRRFGNLLFLGREVAIVIEVEPQASPA